MPAGLLIVNADDFGLTAGVCESILRCAREGIVTSTSVLVRAEATTTFAPALQQEPIGVGIHLSAVGEEPPVLSAREIPSLVDDDGRFPLTWRDFLVRVARRHVDHGDLTREFAAQLELGRSLGLQPDHLDTHQHLHLWPSVASIVCDLALAEGIGALRVPRSRGSGARSLGIGVLSGSLERRLVRCDLRHPVVSDGIDHAGRMHGPHLVSAIESLALSGAASAELSVHPGAPDDPDRDRYGWGYQWGREDRSLRDPALRSLVEDLGLELGTYADLPANDR